jgi:addiction module HigA family antidote
MLMHNPPHPGEVIRELCLEPLDLSVTEAAKALGVSRKTLSAILNGRAGISPEMAVRLSIAFDTSAESWLNQQIQFDLWSAERRRKDLQVKRLVITQGSYPKRMSANSTVFKAQRRDGRPLMKRRA